MNKTAKLLAVMTMAFGFSQGAIAGFHVEPFLGYSLSGDWEQGSSSGDFVSDGPQMGARLGFRKLGFFVAAEYETSSMEAQQSGANRDIDQTLMGISAGWEFPILVRAYATYIISANADLAGTNPSTEYKGSGVKLGAGFTGLPLVALNLEMTTLTYDEYGAGGSGKLANDLEASYYTLSVSAPFNFF